MLVLSMFVSPLVGNAQTVQELQAQIAQLLKLVTELQAQLGRGGGSVPTPTVFCYDFNKNLRVGDRGEAVVALSQALGMEGFNAGMEEKGVFGETLAAAVVAFQEAHAEEILRPSGLSNGTGYVGPATRRVLNRLYGCTVQRPVPVRKPDLRIVDVQFDPASPNVNDWITTTVTVINDSSVDITTPFSVNVQGTLGHVSSLRAGQQTHVLVANAFMFSSQTANVQLNFVVDSGNTIDEANENNNVFTKTFSIGSSVPSITVISPNGGGYWYLGEEAAPITWSTTGVPQTAILDVIRLRSTDTGTGEYILLSNIPNTGSAKINVPSTLPIGAYTLEIKSYYNGSLLFDKSDSYFKVTTRDQAQNPVTITYPNGGEVLQIGSSANILAVALPTADAQGGRYYFALYKYYADRENEILGSLVPFENTFSAGFYWDVGKYKTNNGEVKIAEPGTRYKIGIMNPRLGSGSGYAYDLSDNYFTITSGASTIKSADFNGDGTVSIADQLMLSAKIGSLPVGDDARFDLNRDGVINAQDIVHLNFQVGQTTQSSITITNASTIIPQNIAINLPNQTLGGFDVNNQTGESLVIKERTIFSVDVENESDLTSPITNNITNVTLIDNRGMVVAGPVDVRNGQINFSDSWTIPTGATSFIIRGKLGLNYPNDRRFALSTDPRANWSSPVGSSSGRTYSLPQGVVLMSPITGKSSALTVSVASYPTSQNVPDGSVQFTFTNYQFDTTRSSEDIRVSHIPLRFAGIGGSPTNITQCVLYDGTTQLTTGSNAVNPFSWGDVTFVFNSPLTIPKGVVKTISLKCNVSSSAPQASIYQWGIGDIQATYTGATGATSGSVVNEVIIANKGPVTNVHGSSGLAGDLNSDGQVSITDFLALAAAFGKRMGEIGFVAGADLNNDGIINAVDFNQFNTLLNQALQRGSNIVIGDINGDGSITIADFLAMATIFGKRTGETGFNALADINGDGVINGTDFNHYQMAFNMVMGRGVNYKLGDINGDGNITIADYLALAGMFGRTTGQTGFNSLADLNSDGKIDGIDFGRFNTLMDISALGPNIKSGDLNGDGATTIADYLSLSSMFGKRTGEAGFNANADLNSDGVIDSTDFKIMEVLYKASNESTSLNSSSNLASALNSIQSALWGIQSALR